jgi:glycosyltransferase involved in cell wall biosynthesis
MRPKISIITPTLNQAQYLEETILSVLQQDYERLEYIVVDGGSSDGTLAILKKYAHRLTHWESGQDRGQAHALNKGLERATGDIVAYINSDDVYLPGAFAAVERHFAAHPGCEWLCGDTLVFGAGDIATSLCVAEIPRTAAHSLCWAYRAPQPGMFWKRSLLDGGFAERWRYCFDHELYVRLLLAGLCCDHLPIPVAAYRLHAVSKTVAEGDGFGREFDEIAEIYQDRLGGAGRRWCKATLALRRSVAASRAGRTREAARELMQALIVHPEGVRSRLFWGALKAGLTAGLSRQRGGRDAGNI